MSKRSNRMHRHNDMHRTQPNIALLDISALFGCIPNNGNIRTYKFEELAAAFIPDVDTTLCERCKGCSDTSLAFPECFRAVGAIDSAS